MAAKVADKLRLRPFVSKQGYAALAKLPLPRTLFVFDFDGTLAPITNHPDQAICEQSTQSLLVRLSEVAHVAVVSGRSLKDLMSRLKFGRIYLVGNHGMEGASSNLVLKQAEDICFSWAEKLKALKWPSGVIVEDKGFSFSIHYREAHEPGAREEIMANIRSFTPHFRVLNGKAVVNLLPANAPHKGHAIQQLRESFGLENVVFIGDDETDEDAFRHFVNDERSLTVKVGKAEETQADFFIESQAMIELFLEAILKKI